MSPDVAAPLAEAAARIDRAAELIGQLASRVRDLADALTKDPEGPLASALAFTLERFYTALEDALARAIGALDSQLPSGERWHEELIDRALTPIPGLRPRILAEAAAAPAHRLRSLRHFLRHAYSVELDPSRLLLGAQDVAALATQAGDDLRAFARLLLSATER